MKSTATTPQHLAIICDGNRRWAQTHGLEVFLGHKRAVDEVIEPLVDRAAERGVKFITFWVFSTENWQRAPREVEYLLTLFRKVFDEHVKRLHEKNIRVLTIGDISKFDAGIQERIKNGRELTKDNTGITVVFALNYGGRDELLRAVTQLVQEKIAEKLSQETTTKQGIVVDTKQAAQVDISQEEFSSYLDTKEIPDPDFIIRTSGEQRLSGFFLWQGEYAELAFPKFHFPEFTPEKLDELLDEFGMRKRRFGK